MSDTCEKCGGYLYSGWHTNCPGEGLGKEADDILCLMLGMRNEGHERQLAQAREALRTSRTEEAYSAVCKERDEWKERCEKADAIKKEGGR